MVTEVLRAAVARALNAEGIESPGEIGMEIPANRDHGDWSSNVALAHAKVAKCAPRDLAARLVDRLDNDDDLVTKQLIDRLEIAGPGFINFQLNPAWLHEVLRDVIAAGVEGYGKNDLGEGRRINIEFVSANPTGPLHAGHGRGAIYGDALALLLAHCGYEVARETYINDRGVQMQTYAKSLTARAAGDEVPEDGYQGQYIIDWAAEMPAEADPLEWGYARALADQTETLALLGIEFDRLFSERSLLEDGTLDAALARLRDRDMIYDQDGAVWLRTTDFGDDKDRVLVKSDGELTYLTPDIAYHDDKFSRSDEVVDVLGADHHGYIRRMRAAMEALGNDPDMYDVQITQMVKLMRDGQEVKLSKRTGDIVELRDVVEEVGADATRFNFLLQSIDSQQTFDLALAASQGMDNPVFYTQMAHARVVNIAARAADNGVSRPPLEDVDLSLLIHQRELDILRALQEGPGLIAVAGRERAPHRVVGWVRELASALHSFYQNKDCYVVGDGVPKELSEARLWLVEAARIGLAAGLGLVGVSAPENMRFEESSV